MKLQRIVKVNRMIVEIRTRLESSDPVDQIRRPYFMRSKYEFNKKIERLTKYEAELEALVRQEFGDKLK